MKEFHFSKIYFNKLIFDDENSKIRVIVKETPSIQITEEEYSLRIETRHEENKPIHRNYAIEHHLSQPKHSYPHIQFKFHTEEIGTFRIKLNFKNSEEYKRAILGFIYKIKSVLNDLERHKPGITDEILVLDLVNGLHEEGNFLSQKIFESVSKHEIDFQERAQISRINTLKNNPLLIGFLGETNINKIVDAYNIRK